MSETPKQSGCGRDSLTLLLVGNLNRRFLAFQNHHSIFILPLANDIVSPLKNRFTSRFVTYPWSSKYQDEGAAGGCNNHCVFGSETMSTKNNGDFQWGRAWQQ
jgi:hypothetical protein